MEISKRCGNCNNKFNENICTKWKSDAGLCDKWQKKEREYMLEKKENEAFYYREIK